MYDKCNLDNTAVQEVYCKYNKGKNVEEVMDYTEEKLCVNGCEDGECRKCDSDTQLKCADSQGEEWCCDRLQNYRLRECGKEYDTCEYRILKNWNDPSVYFVNWLNLNENLPKECTCKNSALLILGDEVLTASSETFNFFIN